MDKDRIINKIDGKFDSYELFFLREKVKRFESRERDLCSVDLKEETGVALRATKDNKMIFSYTYEHGDGAAQALLDNAGMLLPIAEEDRDAGFPEAFALYPSLDLYDHAGISVADEEKISVLTDMEGLILDYDKRIVATRNCEILEEEIQVEIINSKGLKAEAGKTLYSLVALCVAKDQDEVSWYDWVWSHSLRNLDGRALGANVARKAISFLQSEQISTGIYDGILTPHASCEMVDILSSSFVGESLYKNKTKLKGKEGEKCFSETLTIVDSGCAGMGSFPFDGEGVPSQENVVVREGVFKHFLFDTYYGRKFGKASTGNGVRVGLKNPPLCGTRGLFIKAGAADVYRHLTNGVIIEELMGTHTANPITGDFSLGAVGHFVESGVPRPFKGVILSGNVFELFGHVRMVGDDLKFYGTNGAPSLYIEGMKISGK